MRLITRRAIVRSRERRGGLVLVAVLVLVALAAMIAAGLLFSVRADVTAAAAAEGGEQAYAAALSGLRAAMAAVQTSPDDPAAWYDNPAAFAPPGRYTTRRLVAKG